MHVLKSLYSLLVRDAAYPPPHHHCIPPNITLGDDAVCSTACEVGVAERVLARIVASVALRVELDCPFLLFSPRLLLRVRDVWCGTGEGNFIGVGRS